MEKYFGVTPDLDIDEQRALLVLKKPMTIDWLKVADLIKRANYTFGGAHLRSRGRFVDADQGRLGFEFASSGQRLEVKNPEAGRSKMGQEARIVGRLEDWKTGTPALIVIALE
jgi:hypothetical protein